MKKLLLIPAAIAIAFTLFAFGNHNDCPAEGKPNPKKGKEAKLKPRERNLNIHINRETAPQPSDFDNGITFQRMYDSKDDSIFDEDKAVTLTGYIYKATEVGMESCNCYTEDKTKYSTNIYISDKPIDKDTRLGDCIVVNVTPYSRTINKDWTTDNVTFKMIGKKVKVSGWLIYNYLQGNRSIETNPNSAEPERRTIWGICPMTDIKMLDDHTK